MPERGCSRSEQPGAAVAMFSVSVCVERLPDEDARPWQLSWRGREEQSKKQSEQEGGAQHACTQAAATSSPVGARAI